MALKTPKIPGPVRQNRYPSPKPVRPARQAAPNNRALVKNFAVATFLVFASYLGWSAYQKKHVVVVRQTLEQSAKSPMQLANGN